MRKSELVEAIATGADMSKAQAERALQVTLDAITQELKKGESVTLVGFGTFYIAERQERTGFNPRTKEPQVIPASKVPRFKAGKLLKESVK
ncbi:MAG: HU family DNA-binding protein [Burkholderiales bacterium]|jgi:DNA-binding protein HU-beta|nr:HU family DNA-binding protein [Burkholderiales bacterium]